MGTQHPLTAFRLAQTPPLSRAQLADRLGVSRPAVYRWEKGDRKINENLVPAIAEKTGIPPRELRPDLADLVESPAPEPTPAQEVEP